MSLSEPDPSRARAAILAEEWRTSSLSSVWIRAGDWHGPAVDSVALALTHGDDTVIDAAGRLGADRAAKGVSLGEGLDDLAVVYRLAGAGELPYPVSKAFAHEWVEVTTSALLARGSTDSLTGLSTVDYLVTRLREIYAEAAAEHTADERCFVVIDGGIRSLAGWQRVTRGSLIGRIVCSVFDRGQTNAVLPSGVVVVLSRRNDALAENVVRLRKALGNDKLHPRVWIESLPASVEHAEKLLLDL